MSGKEDRKRRYQREWMRRWRAAHPQKVAERNETRRAKRGFIRRPAGLCRKCGETFPPTSEYFVTVTKKRRDGTIWKKLAAECRSCRNERYGPFYRKHRARLIKRATEQTKKARLRPEVRDREREWAREHKRKLLLDPVSRAKHNAQGRAWRKSNPDRARLFKHAQPEMKCYRAAARYARKRHAMPPWVNVIALKAVYAEARRVSVATGIEHEVDHIFPIMGKNSTGLHVPWNLQVIPADVNRAKGNKSPEEFDLYRRTVMLILP